MLRRCSTRLLRPKDAYVASTCQTINSTAAGTSCTERPDYITTTPGASLTGPSQRFRIGPIGNVKILDEGTFKGQNVR